MGAIVCVFGLVGLFTVSPNEAKVLQLFGSYMGTVREPGLRWVNPFFTKRGLSLRVRNFESERLKVNDLAGNPIEIAAVVVWKVVDSAEALFHVDNYDNFVHVQSESALRSMALSYPYDAHAEGEISLRSHTAEIAEHLKTEIQERLSQAGVQVLEGGSATWLMPPKSHRRCSSGSRPARSSRPVRRSSREPSAWSRWPSKCSRTKRSSSLTTTRRRRWSATCWSCSALNAARSRSSIREGRHDVWPDRANASLRLDWASPVRVSKPRRGPRASRSATATARQITLATDPAHCPRVTRRRRSAPGRLRPQLSIAILKQLDQSIGSHRVTPRSPKCESPRSDHRVSHCGPESLAALARGGECIHESTGGGGYINTEALSDDPLAPGV